MYQGDGIDEGIDDENVKTRQDKTRQALLCLCSSLVFLVPLSRYLYLYLYTTTQPRSPKSLLLLLASIDGAEGPGRLGWVGLGWVR